MKANEGLCDINQPINVTIGTVKRELYEAQGPKVFCWQERDWSVLEIYSVRVEICNFWMTTKTKNSPKMVTSEVWLLQASDGKYYCVFELAQLAGKWWLRKMAE